MNRSLLLVLAALALSAAPAPAMANSAPPAAAWPAPERTGASSPPWLEPNGLSVVDLVGFVPESQLNGAILFNSNTYGLILYESGTRNGNRVTINTRVYPRRMIFSNWQRTTLGCLGQFPQFDSWGAVVPPSRMRLYENGGDITGELLSYNFADAGQILPIRDSGEAILTRYSRSSRGLTFDRGDALLPANRGCELYVLRLLANNITASFTFDLKPQVNVAVLGQQTFQFHSYIGVGSSGWLGALQQQMSRFGSRHDKFSLSPPAGADYVFVKFPPQSADPYTGQPDLNANQPSGGTYRLAGPGNALSVDHLNAMGLPLGGQWRDGDAAGGEYLSQIRVPRVLASPEYFLPPGIPYDPCMRFGNCPGDLLERIHDKETSMTAVYLSVTRADPLLNRVPLRQVGPDWQPNLTAPMPEARAAAIILLRPYGYLPMVVRSAPPPVPPDDPTGCPCGWFGADGRMVDFIPAP